MNEMSKLIEDRYLGDGVYASFDGYHIWLDLGKQDSTRIALEPSVFDRLMDFRAELVTALKAKEPKP